MHVLRRTAATAAVLFAGIAATTGARAASETFFVFTPLTDTFSVSASGNYSISTWAAALGYTSQLFLGTGTGGTALASASSSVIGTATFNVGLVTGTNYTYKLTSTLPSTTFATITLTGPGSRIAPVTMAPVPEPETYAMLLAGMGLVAAIARRRKGGTTAPQAPAAA
nr:PEP-CTERM sorting domain-containing protein [Xylophilus rhododendri]